MLGEEFLTLNIILQTKTVLKLVGIWFCKSVTFKYHVFLIQKKALIGILKVIGTQNQFLF